MVGWHRGQVSTALERPSWRRDPAALTVVGLPVVGAVVTLALLVHLTSWELVTESVGGLVFVLVTTVWALLPFATAVVVGVSVHRYWRGGMAVALAGTVLLVAMSVWMSWDVLTSESSTAVLALFFFPFMQAAWVGATTAAAVGVAKLRGRRTARAGTV